MAMHGLLTVTNVVKEKFLFLNRLVTEVLSFNPLLAQITKISSFKSIKAIGKFCSFPSLWGSSLPLFINFHGIQRKFYFL
jgi:hypothetical protein